MSFLFKMPTNVFLLYLISDSYKGFVFIPFSISTLKKLALEIGISDSLGITATVGDLRPKGFWSYICITRYKSLKRAETIDLPLIP